MSDEQRIRANLGRMSLGQLSLALSARYERERKQAETCNKCVHPKADHMEYDRRDERYAPGNLRCYHECRCEVSA